MQLLAQQQQQQQHPDFEDCKRCRAQSQDPKKFFTISNSTDGFPHAIDPNVLSAGHPKCRTMVVRRTPAEALTSLLLSVGDVEQDLKSAHPCYACCGATTTNGLLCVKCGARCYKTCGCLTRNEEMQCHQLNSFICIHCNSRAGDRVRCSVCRNGFRLHQYRAICNVCSSPYYSATTETS